MRNRCPSGQKAFIVLFRYGRRHKRGRPNSCGCRFCNVRVRSSPAEELAPYGSHQTPTRSVPDQCFYEILKSKLEFLRTCRNQRKREMKREKQSLLIRKSKCLDRESTRESRVHCYWDRQGLKVVNETIVRVIDSDARLWRASVLLDRLLSRSKRFRRRCFRSEMFCIYEERCLVDAYGFREAFGVLAYRRRMEQP